MPINKYFKGSGEKVMAGMKKTYGGKKAKQVFYATANKRKQTAADTGVGSRLSAAIGGMNE